LVLFQEDGIGMTREGVASSVWLRIGWWGDGTLVNEILDYVSKMEALVGGMASCLVKSAMSIGLEVSWEWIW